MEQLEHVITINIIFIIMLMDISYLDEFMDESTLTENVKRNMLDTKLLATMMVMVMVAMLNIIDSDWSSTYDNDYNAGDDHDHDN